MTKEKEGLLSTENKHIRKSSLFPDAQHMTKHHPMQPGSNIILSKD